MAKLYNYLLDVCSEGHFTVFQKIKWCRAKNIGCIAYGLLMYIDGANEDGERSFL